MLMGRMTILVWIGEFFLVVFWFRLGAVQGGLGSHRSTKSQECRRMTATSFLMKVEVMAAKGYPAGHVFW